MFSLLPRRRPRAWLLLPLAGAALAACISPALAEDRADTERAPARLVTGNVIVSPADPAARIVLPEGVRYLGTRRWDLRGIADADLHLFVEQDGDGRAVRGYWIQFEQYLPSAPEARYQPISADDPVALGRMRFHTRTRYGPGRPVAPPPGSELEKVAELLDASGIEVPAETMSVTFHAVIGEAARKELLIIYFEDLSAAGLTRAGLDAEDGHGPLTDRLQKIAVERAQARISVEPESK